MSKIIEMNEKRNQTLQLAETLRNELVAEAKAQGWTFFCLHATNTTSENDYSRDFYFNPSFSETLKNFDGLVFYYSRGGPEKDLARFLAWLETLNSNQYIEI